MKGSDTLSWAVGKHTTIGIVFGVAALAALGIAWYRRASRGLVRALPTVVVLLGVQGLVGAIQYQSKLPAELVWVHVCLATITWVAILWAWSVAGTPAREESGARRAGAGSAAAPVVMPRWVAATICDRSRLADGARRSLASLQRHNPDVPCVVLLADLPGDDPRASPAWTASPPPTSGSRASRGWRSAARATS